TLDALPRAATSQHNRFQPIIEKLAAGAGGTPKLFATKRGVKLNYQTRFRMTSTEPASAIIPARSRGQAMDWSLVLLSQGIECMIEHREEGWALLVGPQDFERAVAALRQYEIENPGWRWRQELPWPSVVFHWGALIWCLALAAVHWLNSMSGVELKDAGLMHGDAVLNGAWWRLFTAIMLHGDLAH